MEDKDSQDQSIPALRRSSRTYRPTTKAIENGPKPTNTKKTHPKTPSPKKRGLGRPRGGRGRKRSANTAITPTIVSLPNATSSPPPGESIESEENTKCLVCQDEVTHDCKALQCTICDHCIHFMCDANMSDSTYKEHQEEPTMEYYCPTCKLLHESQIEERERKSVAINP